MSAFVHNIVFFALLCGFVLRKPGLEVVLWPAISRALDGRSEAVQIAATIVRSVKMGFLLGVAGTLGFRQDPARE